MKDLTDDRMRISLDKKVDDSYDLVFGQNIFPRIASDLRDKKLGSKYAIITDSNVRGLYAGKLSSELNKLGLDNSTFSFPHGEPNKTMDTCMSIMDKMSKHNFGRDSAILALGGGVVGDMAGFIASVYNRGIPYVQIPTTILSQADSSVGGKTGVDTEFGKNLIGAFKQPKNVYIDVATLSTLSSRDYSSGLAETIKHAIIGDEKFFDYLGNNTQLMMSRDSEFLENIAKKNCKIKGEIVEKDVDENGLRRILNYGHTIGHAVEKLSVDRFNRKESDNYLSHGDSVSIGMMVAGQISNELGFFSSNDLVLQKTLLSFADLETTIPSYISNDDIIGVTSSDKKALNGRVRYVLPISIGKMHSFDGAYAFYVDDDVVIKALDNSR